MGQAAVDTYFPCSIIVMEREGSRRIASAATEAPAAPPPMMTNFLFIGPSTFASSDNASSDFAASKETNRPADSPKAWII